jgi:hypothetical protein
MNEIQMLLIISRKQSRFNHSKKDVTSITSAFAIKKISLSLADQTSSSDKLLKYVYE